MVSLEQHTCEANKAILMSIDLGEESHRKARNKTRSKILDNIRAYHNVPRGWEGGYLTSDTDSATTGQYIVDPVEQIHIADSFENLIAIARKWISENIATRLSELHSYPLEKNELPLNLESAKSLLGYSFSKGLINPMITATIDGILQADWENELEEKVAIRFFSERKIWVTTRLAGLSGTVETKLSSLLSQNPPLNLPDWTCE